MINMEPKSVNSFNWKRVLKSEYIYICLYLIAVLSFLWKHKIITTLSFGLGVVIIIALFILMKFALKRDMFS